MRRVCIRGRRPFVYKRNQTLRRRSKNEDEMAESTNFMLLTFFLLSALLFISAAVSAEEEEFEYEEGSCRGPEHWGELNYPKWKTCADGKRQSPIDIQRENVTVFPKVEALRTRYKAARAVLKNKGHDIMCLHRKLKYIKNRREEAVQSVPTLGIMSYQSFFLPFFKQD